MTKLTADQKKEIWLIMRSRRKMSDKALVRQYGVCRRTLYAIAWEYERAFREWSDAVSAQDVQFAQIVQESDVPQF